MAQTTTDTAASTVSGAGAASSFSGGTGTEAEFGSLGALSPTWWEPEDGSEPEPWLTPDQAFERFFEWTSDRGIELWDHQEEALMDLAAGDHVILGTPTGSGKSLVALGMLFMGMAQGKRCRSWPIAGIPCGLVWRQNIAANPSTCAGHPACAAGSRPW